MSLSSLVELPIWVCQGNVANRETLFLSELLIRLHDKLIQELVVRVVFANWHHDNTAWVQLVNKSLWHCIGDGTGMDNIIGRSILLTLSAITTEDLNASILELITVAPRQVVHAELGQLFDVFDPNNVGGSICFLDHFVERRTEVAAATANVKHSCTRFKF